MDEWLLVGVYQVEEAMRQDRDYRQIIERMNELELEYKKIVNKLPENEQMRIEDYIAVCEAAEYQRARLAYQCGRKSLK